MARIQGNELLLDPQSRTLVQVNDAVVWIYQADGVTPATIYAAATGGAVIAQPLTSSYGLVTGPGGADWWLDPGVYVRKATHPDGRVLPPRQIDGYSGVDSATLAALQVGMAGAGEFLLSYWHPSDASYKVAFDAAYAVLAVRGGGTLILPPNLTMDVDGQLNPPSNTTTLGPRSAVVRAKNGTSITVFVATSKTNVHVRGFTVDGNKANVTGGNGVDYVACTNSTVEDLVVLSPFNDGIIQDALGATGCVSCEVRRCKVYNPGSHGIALSGTAGNGFAGGSQYALVSECYVENPGTAGINGSQCAHSEIVDNRVKGTSLVVTGWPGIRLSNGSSFNLVDANVVVGTSRGFLVAADAGAGDGPPQHNTYGVNHAMQCLQHGMLCEAPFNDLGDLKVIDCAADSAFSTSDGSAIRVNNASWCKIGGGSTVVDSTGTKHRTSVLISGTSDLCDIGDGVMVKGYITQPVSVVGTSTVVGRIVYDPADAGASITRTAAAALSLRDWSDDFIIAGTADITSVSSLRKRVVRWRFTGTKATNGVVDGGNLKLAGNFPYTPDSTLTLYCDGTNYTELARSLN